MVLVTGGFGKKGATSGERPVFVNDIYIYIKKNDAGYDGIIVVIIYSERSLSV